MPKQVLLGGVSKLPQLYDGVAYAGNSSARTISTSFSPDLVIAKRRTGTGSPSWFNSVSGDYVRVESDGGLQEYAVNTSTIAFETGGFSLGGATLALNNTGDNYMAWCFKAGGTAVTNTDGAITSSVSANPFAGFSIVAYTGTGTTNTVGHGLTQAPELIIVKNRDATADWVVYTTAVDSSFDYLFLNLNSGKTDSGLSSPTSSVFTASSGTQTNASGNDYIAYCFHSVTGVSKLGSYTGNGSTTGPVITTGFRPKFILFKRTNSTSNWLILDSDRSPSNPANDALFFDLNTEELESSTYNVDFNSDGFAIKATSGNINADGSTYLYVAFA